MAQLSGSRSTCIAVKPDKNDKCNCAFMVPTHYLPKALTEGPTKLNFRKMCKEAGLSISQAFEDKIQNKANREAAAKAAKLEEEKKAQKASKAASRKKAAKAVSDEVLQRDLEIQAASEAAAKRDVQKMRAEAFEKAMEAAAAKNKEAEANETPVAPGVKKRGKKTQTEGFEGGRSTFHAGEQQMSKMDFPALEDLGADYSQDFFDGFLPNADEAKDMAVGALAGGGGILAVVNLVEWIGAKAAVSTSPTVQNLAGPKARAGMTILLGLAGSRAIYAMEERRGGSRTASTAFLGAVAGVGLARLVSELAGTDAGALRVRASLSALNAPEVDRVPPEQFFSMTRGPVGEGFDQVAVTDDAPLALSAFHAPEVEVDELSGWLG